MRKYSIFFLFVLLFILIAALVASLGYPPRVRFFPIIIIIVCLALVVAELLKEIRAAFAAEPGSRKKMEAIESGKGDRTDIKFLITISWMGGLALMIWLFGFLVALPLFTFIYIKSNGEMWRWATILSITMLAIVYIGFILLLKMPLYEGVIFLL